ncbi:MAG: flagellar assembly protein FliW [Deltaproteobacteria bacterium]|nr:flagellar assembly protein FliW [Deltaproteobacteria bacterium]
MTPDPQKTPTEPVSATIATKHFGEIVVREDQIITFSPGLLGFGELHRYILIEHGQDSPFLWLQCVDKSDPAFVVIDPIFVLPDYQIGPITGIEKELDVQNLRDLKLLVILTIPPGRPQDMTANLMGPLLINLANRRGKQLVLESSPYSHKHPVLPAKS